MRIRWRLALYGAAVTVAAVVAFGMALTLLASAAAPQDQEEELAALARAAAADLAGATVDDLAGTEPLFMVDAAATTDPFVAVLARDGSPVYATGNVAGAALRVPAAVVVEALDTGASAAVVQAGPGVELRVFAVPVEPAGVVVAVQSTDFARQQVAGLVAVIWVAGIVTLLVAVLVSWLVSRRAMRPLRRLAETTDDIARTGDLSRRLPPVRARDEVGALTTSFNAMLDRVQDAHDRLEVALDAQRRFVADASHELRGPLTTIRNNAGLLTGNREVGAADRTEALGEIAAEADRMATLVDDLLAVARGDAGTGYHLAPLDLATVAHAAGRGVPGVEVRAAAGAEVRGDRAALTRLVGALVDNACKHGGGDVVVAVAAGDGTVELNVRDHGPGIPPGDLERVFERFYRADPARSPAGTGLGLAIAAGIAAAHGGTIAAANHPDGGAVFTVTLPRLRVSSPAHRSPIAG